MNNKQILLNILEKFDNLGTSVETRVLAFLIENPKEWTAKELCKELDVNDSKIYGALNSLEEKDIIGKSSYKRPARYYFTDPVSLHTYLENIIEEDYINRHRLLKKTMDLTYKYWNPNKPELGNIAYLYRGSDIHREIKRLWKLAQHNLTILLASPSTAYIETINSSLENILQEDERILKVKISIPNQSTFSKLIDKLDKVYRTTKQVAITKKVSIWLGNSYIIADDTLMLNISHNPSMDVAILTNDNLLVSNISKCWTDDSCCVLPSSVELQLNMIDA